MLWVTSLLAVSCKKYKCKHERAKIAQRKNFRFFLKRRVLSDQAGKKGKYFFFAQRAHKENIIFAH